jgi:hypothetical protein
VWRRPRGGAIHAEAGPGGIAVRARVRVALAGGVGATFASGSAFTVAAELAAADGVSRVLAASLAARS